jgi:DSF synthase
MGAYSMLTRRIGMARAERLIFSGRVHSADEMYDLGVIDQVVDDGRGEEAVAEYLGTDHRNYGMRRSIYQARQRVHPLTLAELRDITELWVETTLKLTPADLRRMTHLQSAQLRRLQREGAATLPRV